MKVWQMEGALVMSASPGQGAGTQIRGGAFYQSRLLFPSRAGSCPALAGGGDRAPTRGGRGCSCDPSLKAQPFTLVGVEEVKRCNKYDGCSCPNSESVLVISRNPKCLFPVVQKHTSPQSKTKPYQNSIRWRHFPHGFHFSGRHSVPFYFLLLLEQKGFE